MGALGTFINAGIPRKWSSSQRKIEKGGKEWEVELEPHPKCIKDGSLSKVSGERLARVWSISSGSNPRIETPRGGVHHA
jgi:hypothetical protein